MDIEKLVFGLNKLGVHIKLDYLYTYKLNDTIESTNNPHTLLKIGTTSDLAEIAKLRVHDKYETFKKRITYNNRLFIVMYDEKTAGYCWISDREVYPKQTIVKHFPKNTIYWYDVFISSEFRGKGLFKVIFNKAASTIKRGGTLGCWIDIFNKRSLSVHEKMKWQKHSLILTIRVSKLLYLQKIIWTY